MPSSSTIKPLTISEYKAMVEGIPTYCPTATFMAAGQSFTAAQAVTFIQSVLNGVAAVSAAKAAWVDARLAEEQLLQRDSVTVRVLRTNIAGMFVNNTSTLAAFQIAPKKVRQPLSAEARTIANAKAKATRAARGTTSKKQKAQVSGDVVGVTFTPVTGSTKGSTGTSTPLPATAQAATTASAPGGTSAIPATTPATPPATPAASGGTTPAIESPTHP